MSAAKLLTRLQEREIALWSEGGQLRFRAPSGALTDELRAEIKRYRAELLDLLAPAGDAVRLAPRSRAGELPTSFGQEQLWFLDQLNPGTIAYSAPMTVQLLGALDVDAFRRSVGEIVHRHAALRSSFPADAGRPVVVVADPEAFALAYEDLEATPATARLAEAVARARSETRQPFDLARGPVFRAVLYRLADDDHVFHITTHHIVWDAMSAMVFFRELTTLYDAYRAGEASPLSPLEVSYIDYACWQRDRVEAGALDAPIAYWKKQLHAVPTLQLPTDRPHPRRATLEGAAVRATIPPELAETLLALGQREGATPYHVLLAAFFVLLAGYTGQDDLPIGTPVNGRSDHRLQSLIGLFVNWLVLRGDVSGNPAFAELLPRVRDMALDAIAHQDVSFDQVVEALRPERSPGRNPLFQVLFNYLDFSGVGEIESSLGIARVDADEGVELDTARFDLTMLCSRQRDTIEIIIEYKTALFDAATVQRILDQYVALIGSIAADPQRRISELLSSTVRSQLAPSDETAASADELDVLAMLDAAIASRLDQPAIISEAQAISFGDLDRASNRIAHALRAGGLSSGDRVVVLLRDRPQIIAAMLGIWRAGGVFVPLDPDGPAQRLGRILDEIQPAVAIIETDDTAHGDVARSCIVLLPPGERGWCAGHAGAAALDTFDDDRPVLDLDPRAMSYVYYTSGSTGRPKGIAGTLRSVAHFVRWEIDTFGVGPGTRVSQLTVPTFDAFFRDVLVPLCAGGTVCVPPDPGQVDPQRLLRWIDEKRVQLVHCVPSLFAALTAAASDPNGLASLEAILMAGEVLPVDLVRDWMRLYGERIKLVNLYGATETTMIKLYHVVEPQDLERGFIPIGKPMRGARAVLLDDDGNVRLHGAVGELYIRTPYRTLGYYDDPALTDTVFVPNPFGKDPSDRIYKSGDLARMLDDGSFQFVGRKDNQVKVRGVRVELEEIEAALREHPAVDAAGAIARADTTGDLQLVAYVVPRDETLDVDDLRAFLESRLPEPSVPAAYVPLETLPRTSTGKLDRKALPDPGQWQAAAATDFVAPESETEKLVGRVWTEILGLERVGRDDDFFRLGGHSLRAVQVIVRLRELLQTEVPLQCLFENRTLATLAVALDAMQADGAMMPGSAVALTADPDRATAPLSFAQHRLWILEQLDPGTHAYVMAGAVRLHGDLDVAALRRALDRIVERHAVLRTRMRLDGADPVQEIMPDVTFPLDEVDLFDVPETDRDRRAEAIITERGRRPFDLGGGKLVRGVLVRFGPTDHAFAWNVHHIASDGWSQGVFFRELASLYRTECEGTADTRPDLPVQYADYADWQRRRLTPDVLASHLDYWTTHLAGMPESLDLPTDRPRPAVLDYAGSFRPFVVSRELSERVETLARDAGVTPYVMTLAVFKTLLARYTGATDVVVGTPVANRDRRELEDLIGCFVDTLVLRTDLSGDPTFRELLARTEATTLGAFAHQDMPFEELVTAIRPDRNLGRNPLFQVTFTFQNAASGVDPIPGLSMTRQDFGVDACRFDVEFHIGDHRGALGGAIRYSTRLFDAAMIDRMITHYLALLEAVVADPDTRLSDLAMLDDAERQELLGAPATSYPADRCLHEQFETQAARAPDAVALTFDDRAITYGELNARANQLAHRLRGAGVGPDVRVGLCVERGPDMLVGILGTLKAGGAYVPIDPAYPAERIDFILADSAAPVLVTERGVLDRRPDHGERIVMCVDDPALDAEPTTNPAPLASPESLAYVIYTSGSTGTPKGVLVEHRNVTRLFTATDAWFGFDDTDVWTLFHSFAFDFSVWEIWGALLHGGRLVVVPHDVSRAPDELYRLLRRERVTVLNQTPSAFRQLVTADEQLGAGDELALRLIVFGGEALDLQSLRPWFERHGDTRPQLVNMYGITETTVHVTYRPITMADLDSAPGSMIGRPIPDLAVYVLDEHRQLAPIGVPGELFVGGAGVARGYLDRDELTAERFIDDPFTRGGRLYRSGDLGRRLENGDIEYLGRKDDQVKIRGFRIELGEIASIVRRHPRIADVAVIARADEDGERRLVAYVTTTDDTPADLRADLRVWLRDHLPEHMVPATFVRLDAIPLTANGKVDHRALPAPDAADRRAAETAFTAPRTDAESTLAALWAKILRVDRVGIHDNFFELGGDSILAIRIVAAANEAGLRLTPRQMFECQTIAELAAVVGTARVVDAEQGIVTGDAPLTPIQHWFFGRELADVHHYNQATLLTVRAPLAPAVCERAVKRLLEHHDALRLRFTRTDGGWAQRIAAPDDDVPFSVVDLSSIPAAERRDAIAAHANELQASFDLVDGPLVRVAMFDLGSSEPARLLIAIHHLAVDGVSWRILLEDLQRLCEAQGETDAALPAKTSSYAAWARRLETHARSDAAARQLEHWRDQPWADVEDLPVDRAGDADNTIGTAFAVAASLSEAETQALLQEVPHAYGTQINDVLLTALVMAIAPWTGRPSVLVDLEGHGREDLFEDADVSRTVGWFTSMYPVLLHVDGAERDTARLDVALKAVKEQLRAVPDRGLSYGLLRYLHSPEVAETLAALPHPQVSFNYLGQFDQTFGASSMFGLAEEPMGELHGARNRRDHKIDVVCRVMGGRLHVSWVASRALHDRVTMEGLAERFSAALRGLIEHCRRAESRGFTPSDFPQADVDQTLIDAIERRFGHDQIEDLLALSPMQQGLMYHSLSEATTGVYVEHARFAMETLDAAAFREAWQAVIDRHSALRTSVVGAGGDDAVQLVHRRVTLPISEHDCREMTPDARNAWIQAFLAEDARRGFDLAEAPLMRLALFRIDDAHYEVAWAQHHIILDGWSLPVAFDDFLRIYAAIRRGEPLQLPPAPSYGAYIAWLRRQDMDAAERYWRERLAGFEAPTAIGVMRADVGDRSAAPDYAAQELPIASSLLGRLRGLATDAQVTINTVMLGAWSLLLGAYSGEDDVVFGTTVSGRPADLPGVEAMVGLLINTLPLRVPLAEDDASVTGWLRRLQSQQMTQWDYQHSPLWKVQQWSDVPSGTPLFDSLYVFENYPDPRAGSGGGDGEGDTAGRGARMKQERTGYPLAVCISPKHGLVVRLNYDRARFDDDAIARMLRHLENLLDAMTASPDRRPLDLPVLDDGERHRVLVEWNETGAGEVPCAAPACVHAQFAARVAETPSAPALAYGDETLTYGELNDRANRLAHTLQSMGVGPDVVVGLCVDRSPVMIVGLLGILKAGGAYLPLDPTYPRDRLAFMLADSGVPVLLTEGRLLPELPEHDAHVVCLDRDWATIAAARSDDPPLATTPDDLCYMIYTSGSTGQPKGALLPHAGLCNVAAQQQRAFGVGPGSRVLQFASLSFDASTFEIVMALLSGATLYLRERETLRPGPDLLAFLRTNAISVVTLPPTALAATPVEPLPDLATITVAGEACPGDLVAQWAPGRRFFNLYGPTEATIWSTMAELRAENGDADAVHIGRPIGGVTAYVLDTRGRPVPTGVPGELHIGGAGVARGYHERSALTNERFVENPFGAGRLYRTGDLVRHRADGNLDFVGRVDHQVKLRGFRIELGEIEACLATHDGVRESLALVREDAPGDPRLAAYVTPDTSGSSESAGDTETPDDTTQWSDDHVGEWEALYEDTYGATATTDDPTFNIAGWNSSETGLPIPADEMREWVDRTVERVLELSPQRVLELGCGTGLLLFRIAPHCAEYVGTDFSRAALEYIDHTLRDVDLNGCDITLAPVRADAVGRRFGNLFDTVVINSVVQYFPSAAYLLETIEAVMKAVAPGGRIVVGDVRNLALLEPFHATVQLAQATDDTAADRLRQRIHRAVNQDQELVIDPSLFAGLAARLPRVTHVEIEPKRGRYDNELSRFRYDVVLHLDGGEGETTPVAEWRTWTPDELGLDELRAQLAATPDELAIRGVPNRRVQTPVLATELLRRERSIATAADLARESGDRASACATVEPQDLLDLGAERGYAVSLSLATARPDGSYDVVYRRRTADGTVRGGLPCFAPRASHATPPALAGLTNNPLRARLMRDLVPQLRTLAQSQLPEHMVPAAYVVLDEFPLTPNGKVDRRALPAPDSVVTDLPYEAPSTPTEEALARMWAEILQLDRVGVHQNFFDLGGHSLNVTQVVSRVRAELGHELPIQAVFEAPTIAELAERVTALDGTTPIAAITPVVRNAPLPLSSAQKRLWFLEQLDPGSAAYGIGIGVELSGPLDVTALERSLGEIVARHEALRTTFAVEDGQAVQVIASPASLALPVTDLSSLPPDERRARADEMLRDQRAETFDLETGPLVRCALVRLADTEHRLLVAMHHIVTDGWSMGVFVRELGALYAAFTDGRPSPLSPLEIQYPDFAAWQNRWFESGALDEQIAYWQDKLADAPALELPTDRSRPPVQTFNGGAVAGEIDAETLERLNAFGQGERATLFMTTIAALSVVLGRLAGQDDVVVGSPSASRNHAQLEDLIGFFVNNLVLRTDLSGDPSFRALLRRVRADTLAAYEHQDVPFEYIVETLGTGRDPSRSPLFQVAITMLNASSERLHLPGLELRTVSSGPPSARFDLEVHVAERRNGLGLAFVYNSDLFDAATIERLATQISCLLREVAGDPDRRLSELGQLDAHERDELLVRFNEDAAGSPVERCVHELFADQAARDPDAIAVRGPGVSLTYAELDARANRLANHLGDHGVGPESRVAILVERDVEMIVGVLGVLKSGGAYVPLNPEDPPARLGMLLDQVDAAAIVTHAALRDRLPADGRTVIALDTDAAAIEAAPATAPAVDVNGRSLAYVIFTSGSTGTPKGVCVEHRSIVRLVATPNYVTLDPDEVVLQFAPLSFDASTFEIWGSLLNGATLAVFPPGMPTLGELGAFIRANGVTTMWLTAAVFAQMLDDHPEDLAGVRQLLTGGEALPVRHVRHAIARLDGGRRLINGYGPTENTTFTCCHPMDATTTFPTTVPIGRPIHGTTVYILDERLRPLPIGAPGELYTGGDGVARGYLDDPRLTAERFVPDPFGETPGARLYRTGDVARWRADGTIEFIGRRDHQVKVRGFRIELGEIETALLEHPDVKNTVVMCREDEPGDKRLVAYVVGAAADDRAFDDAVRSTLRDRLPAYMIPNAIVRLDAIPLTPNGKVDRGALPAPSAARAGDPLVAPATPMEQTLADVWKELIGIDEVDVRDNFFDIGGHSLLMVQAAARMQERTGVRIDLRHFTLNTLRQLARLYEEARGDANGTESVQRSRWRGLGSKLARLVPGVRRSPRGDG